MKITLKTAAFIMAFQSFLWVCAQEIPKIPVRSCLNTAHRGASGVAPENTLAAYREAVAAGANGAECDVRMTKDGVLILHNDPTLTRIGGGDAKVTDATLEEIKKLDAGSWKNEKFAGEKVPTLEEFLLYLKGTDCHPVIELKVGGLEQKTAELLKKTGMYDRATIISFSQSTVKNMRQAAPDLPIAWLFHENLKDKGTAEENADQLAEMLISTCKDLNINLLDISGSTVSKPLVEKLNKAGIHVWCYTVDDPMQMKKLLECGVESITTNRPDRLTKLSETEKKIKAIFGAGKKFTPDMPVRIRMNVAHRGASFIAPENTIAAYKQAIADGATGAECDLYSTSDGVVVLFHDNNTKRTLGVDGTIPTKTFEEIRKLDAGVWKNEKYKGEKVPTLDEYLLALKGTECYPVIEIKQGGFEQKVVDAVRKHDMLDVSSVIAFSAETVKEIRRLEPKLPVAWLYGESIKAEDAETHADRLFERILWTCVETDTNMVDLSHNIVSKTLVKKLRDAGIHAWCWTVNDAARMNTLLDWGIESITTDRPDMLAEVLKNRSKK